jgi:hypothetical protein
MGFEQNSYQAAFYLTFRTLIEYKRYNNTELTLIVLIYVKSQE